MRSVAGLSAMVLAAGCSGTVFSWNGDDLGEWVTVNEMTGAFDDLSMRYAGVELDSEAEFEHQEASNAWGDEWVWRVRPEADLNRPVDDYMGWAVHVHNGEHTAELEEFGATDPRLPAGVVHGAGYGIYTLRGPNSDESICIRLSPPLEHFGYPVEGEAYEEMVFEIASMMLKEMGWAD